MPHRLVALRATTYFLVEGMRIAHIVSTFPPYRGGQGNVAREIAERTAARGHEAVIVTPTRSTAPIVHHVRPLLRVGNAAWCPGIPHTLERLQPDIVHFHWPFIGAAGSVLRWRLRDARRRLVVQYHMDLVAPGWRGAAFMAYQSYRLPHVVTVADRVVVSSLDYARHGALASYTELLGDRLIEIPLGVDAQRFVPVNNVPEGFSPPQSDRGGLKAAATVLFVGGLDRAHAFKGIPVLLEAIARVPAVRAQIVGDGDLRPQYEAQTRSLGIADRVAFLGAISDAMLPAVYQSADVLVLPSTARSEAFGVVLLEAMASGIPVIASDLPGVRTVIAEGETGFLVPPDDVATLAERLADLVGNPERRHRMGATARRRVEEWYDWDRIIDQWLNVYSTVTK